MLQVLRKEQAMSEDSAFLKGQMEALLKVSAMLPARVACITGFCMLTSFLKLTG